MTVWTYGSINIDLAYYVQSLPAPGETVFADEVTRGLGGKGANQSVAAARAGSHVIHIGAVGEDGDWAIARLRNAGVDTSQVQTLPTPTGHAIISVAVSGENAILVFGGANAAQDVKLAKQALTQAKPADILLLQNETPGADEVAAVGRAAGMAVLYSAAPFDLDATKAVLPEAHVILVNAVEAAELRETGLDLSNVALLVTLGSEGAEWHDPETGQVTRIAAIPVEPVDTTGAGDTFAGYFAAGLDQRLGPIPSMERAAAAAALKVTRKGTADAIPTSAEVADFAASR